MLFLILVSNGIDTKSTNPDTSELTTGPLRFSVHIEVCALLRCEFAGAFYPTAGAVNGLWAV